MSAAAGIGVVAGTETGGGAGWGRCCASAGPGNSNAPVVAIIGAIRCRRKDMVRFPNSVEIRAGEESNAASWVKRASGPLPNPGAVSGECPRPRLQAEADADAAAGRTLGGRS